MTPVEKRYHGDLGANLVQIYKRKKHGGNGSFINELHKGCDDDNREQITQKELNRLIYLATKVDNDIIVHIHGQEIKR